jgi:UTP--glucose-1-phosphate uridylyltransferase
MHIRKAVFPVAGLGTRFLPATKASPKEMLPIVDKPLIQYAVEEAIAAGITELIFITSGSKRAIEDHFDTNFELENHLKNKSQMRLLDLVTNIVPKGVHCIYVRQPEALGLGHAVLCAKPVIGDEPFAVLLADDLIDGEHTHCLSQMCAYYQTHKTAVVAVQRILPEQSRQYGVVDVPTTFSGKGPIAAIVEKPAPDVAPSAFGVVGRYILTPPIMDILEFTPRGAGNEIQLTDAIAILLTQHPVHAFGFEGIRYDCGSKLGYLMATVEYGLKHPELGEKFAQYLSEKAVLA